MEGKHSSDIIMYSSPEGNIRVEVVYSGETFWHTQKRMLSGISGQLSLMGN